MKQTHKNPAFRARLSLEGLSVGDALGERFFSPEIRLQHLRARSVPEGRWRWTDDTAMALSIVEILETHGTIEQDELAAAFARRYQDEPRRGYGPAQDDLLTAIGNGGDWRQHAAGLFRGAGSFGNGAAMRAAPLGAWFAEQNERRRDEARRSAIITHAHADGVAGAIAVAEAAAWTCHWTASGKKASPREMLEAAFANTPSGATRRGLELALTIPLDSWEFDAANELGDGSRITSADTVPFALWVAAAHLDSYADALWTAIRVEGDIDTNCAIIGGIVALSVGESGIPQDWRRRRERLQ